MWYICVYINLYMSRTPQVTELKGTGVNTWCREHTKFILYLKSFFHEKINFICSNQRVIFFLLHRYECFENKKKDEKQQKNKGMTSEISSLVRIGKISRSYPGCSFVRVVYFSVKNTHLCNKIIHKAHSNEL